MVELKAAKGYKLDDTPYQIEVKDGGTATLEIIAIRTFDLTNGVPAVRQLLVDIDIPLIIALVSAHGVAFCIGLCDGRGY